MMFEDRYANLRSAATGRRRPFVAVTLAATLLVAAALPSLAGQSSLAAVRQATAAFHNLSTAEAAGYGLFYVCTDEPDEGAMGQHFVKGSLVGDGAIDPLTPEALIYEPLRGGGYRLVGVEYVVLTEAWDAGNSSRPTLFGHSFHFVDSPNRYGLDPFYELHVWLWKPNPSGMFHDWNPRVSCAFAE